ncbi:MAG: hypothetical protein L0G70_06375 [Rubrobacter sp.]|nr:hypothetical protein [Rubrobacter sp.]
MKFGEHYERDRRHQPDRSHITLEMCERVKNKPLQIREQEDGRIVYWGYLPERDRYLRVVVLADGETIWTAHLDRNFRKKVQRGEAPGQVETEE